MLTSLSRIFTKLLGIYILLWKAILFRFLAGRHLLGSCFDTYGRKKSFRYLLNNDFTRFMTLFCNPVSIVRYFEFSFALSYGRWNESKTWFDISSPKLLLLYILDNFKHINLTAINPDTRDYLDTKEYLSMLGVDNRVELFPIECAAIDVPDGSYDIVTSLSVLEHIPDPYAELAIKEMFRILKPGGVLILTFPCCNEYFEEWRDKDVYAIETAKTGGKYFFQRFYDIDAINSLYKIIGKPPVLMKFFGEKKKGTYFAYEERWKQFGLRETVRDPLYISKEYKFYEKLTDMPGIGVCGLIFRKEQ